MLEKFFCLDLKTSGLVIAALQILSATFSFLSWIATYQYQPIISLVAIIIFAGLSLLLFYGIQESIFVLMLPWLVIIAIILAFFGIFFIIFFIGLFAGTSGIAELPVLSACVFILEVSLLYALCIYAWLAVFSLCCQIRRGRANATEHPETLQALESGYRGYPVQK